jgi:hypothetical protein
MAKVFVLGMAGLILIGLFILAGAAWTVVAGMWRESRKK